MRTMHHLGIVVYFWGLEEQNRLLVDCLDPLAQDISGMQTKGRFWFTRFDTRGPHVFAVFPQAPTESDSVVPRIKAQLETYLDEHPSRVTLPPEKLEARHKACRGKVVCSADARPGFGRNNSYLIFQHPDNGYPFGRCSAKTLRDRWRAEACDLTSWAVDMLRVYTESPPVAPAVALLAAADRQLRDLGRDATAYWRYHAFSLLPGLPERLEEDPESVTGSLYARLGESWRNGLESAFSETRSGDSLSAALPRLVRISLGCGEDSTRPWAPLRESLHGVLGQLGLPVRRQIPVILYAWLRNLYPVEASLRSPQRPSTRLQESRS